MSHIINKKTNKLSIILVFVLMCASSIFADGWVNDGYGNWLYEENGNFIKNETRVIDGIECYFNYQGYWIPRGEYKKVWLVNKEIVSFTIEGKDYSDRKYKTKIKIPMPIVAGENADAINEFIRKEFNNTIRKYFEEWRLSILFLQSEIEISEMLEAQNARGIISFGYLGGGMFNLYIDTNKYEMWAIPNKM